MYDFFAKAFLSSGKSKWGLSNGGLRPLSAILHFCGLFGPLSEGNFRHKMTTIVGNRGQLWTSTLSPHLESPHLDFPDFCNPNVFSKRPLTEEGKFWGTPLRPNILTCRASPLWEPKCRQQIGQ